MCASKRKVLCRSVGHIRARHFIIQPEFRNDLDVSWVWLTDRCWSGRVVTRIRPAWSWEMQSASGALHRTQYLSRQTLSCIYGITLATMREPFPHVDDVDDRCTASRPHTRGDHGCKAPGGQHPIKIVPVPIGRSRREENSRVSWAPRECIELNWIRTTARAFPE